jgi:histone H3/H4
MNIITIYISTLTIKLDIRELCVMAEEFTITPFRRLLKKEADLRISPEAVEEMRRIVGDLCKEIAHLSIDNALKEERKTILERDIKLAYLKINEAEKNKTD